MSDEKRLPRPNLQMKSSKWSAALTPSTFATRVAIVTTVTAVIAGLSIVFIYPYWNIDKFRQIQRANRDGINPAETQPAGLPIWRDPFERKKN